MAKIVIADDDLAILDATTMALELAGHQVCSTCRGNALMESDQWAADLYLLDVRMSGCDGIELAQRLRRQQTKRVPIVLFSANRDIARLAVIADADDYLVKPFDVDLLINKVEQCLQTTY